MSKECKRVPITPSLRWKVLKRDSFRCRYCGAQSKDAELVIDHVIPVSKGGETNIDNLVTSCVLCNQGKHTDTVKKVPERSKEYKQACNIWRYMAAVHDLRQKHLKEEVAYLEYVINLKPNILRRISLDGSVIRKVIKQYGFDMVADAVYECFRYEDLENKTNGEIVNDIEKMCLRNANLTEGIRVVPVRFNEKKYLVVCYVSADKSKCWKKIYLVEHLVNEKLEVTDQTLADEERIFKTPQGYPNK